MCAQIFRPHHCAQSLSLNNRLAFTPIDISSIFVSYSQIRARARIGILLVGDYAKLFAIMNTEFTTLFKFFPVSSLQTYRYYECQCGIYSNTLTPSLGCSLSHIRESV